jgi:hypothetical protein
MDKEAAIPLAADNLQDQDPEAVDIRFFGK